MAATAILEHLQTLGLTWPTGSKSAKVPFARSTGFLLVAGLQLLDRRETSAGASAEVPGRKAAFFPPYPDAGVPYYRFLFRAMPRTAYWIVYRVYEDEGLVRVLQFRSTAQDETF